MIFTFNDRVCYECGDKGNISRNIPNKNEATRLNESLMPKGRAFQMILDEEMRMQEFKNKKLSAQSSRYKVVI